MPHRYFTTEIADGTAVLRGTDAHHLARVMRARMGDTVILTRTFTPGRSMTRAAARRGIHRHHHRLRG